MVDYNDESTLVSALKDQQFLIITLSVMATSGADSNPHSQLVRAAAKAGVPYVMPNCYGFDISNSSLASDAMFANGIKYVAEIESLGMSSYIVMCCGFWYEWSLALGEPWFGFDFKNHKVVFFDDGETKINVSTWLQCGRALAGLLSLKELPEDENHKELTISKWKNNYFYISSFLISQRDMLNSIQRLDGTSDKDWEITTQPTKERWAKGVEDFKKGERAGFARAMYSRVFFPNGGGDFETSKGLANDLVGLPKESLDEATKTTLEMVESGWNPFGH